MVISRFASQLPSLPPDLLRRALSPELHRNSRLACCRIWPWWFVGFVLVVWALAKQGSLTGHGITASIDGGLGEGFYGANGLALAPRQRSLLAAIIRRWTQSSRPARAPTPKEEYGALHEMAEKVEMAHLLLPCDVCGAVAHERLALTKLDQLNARLVEKEKKRIPA
eukprot:1123327-Pelagomonas_calceolata.AAC.3